MARFDAATPVERLTRAFQECPRACKWACRYQPPAGILRRLSVLAPVLLFGLTVVSAKEETAATIRVVDGDTIEVALAGKAEKIRLIGVDTPETVDPRKPVEFFGKEASAFTKRLVEGKQVVLRDELGGQDRDKYGRLLRYVYLEDGTFVNAEIIRQGYGHAYVRFPFSYMEEFRAHERQAREQGLGLWGAEVKSEPGQARAPTEGLCVGSSQSNKYHRAECVWAQKISPANLVKFESSQDAQSRGYLPCKVCSPLLASGAPDATAESSLSPSRSIQPSAQLEDDVYVTRTGAKYHRAGCRYLSKSMIPIPLKDAAQRYAPCSVCRPAVPKN